MEAAPPIGFNLTYSCPEGMVFNHDWFAIPFILMTCQVTSSTSINILLTQLHILQEEGVFDQPAWDSYECVLRKRYNQIFILILYLSILATTTECFDCTTTSKYFTQIKNIVHRSLS